MTQSRSIINSFDVTVALNGLALDKIADGSRGIIGTRFARFANSRKGLSVYDALT